MKQKEEETGRYFQSVTRCFLEFPLQSLERCPSIEIGVPSLNHLSESTRFDEVANPHPLSQLQAGIFVVQSHRVVAHGIDLRLYESSHETHKRVTE